MSIAAGTRLGHYEISAPLGAGGMGEVYRAKDTRLDRAVAVKVLPADFAKDADRLKRFEQEARATSALNHPNILTIYDIGQHAGAPYLVAELLEGEELRAQLPPHSNAGALPVKRAIEYAQQIAAGLSAAHDKGIVHRDLKPENLFVTKDGRVKILDFGLAKLKLQKFGGGVDSEAATLKPLTNPGVVMGTVGYMSPEQVRGHETDHRSDIFSFGMILYEMLSGQRAFNGTSVADVMSAILKEDPPELSETNAKVPPALDKIVRRCLEKQPERRFQSASDLGFALEAMLTPSSSGAQRTEAVQALDTMKRSGWRDRVGWIAAGAMTMIALAFGVAYVRRPATPTVTAIRLSVNPPEGAAMFEQPTISPDGRTLAFVSRTTGIRQIWVRPLDSPTAKPLAGTENGDLMFWSPDSQSLAFFAGRKLKKVAFSSGAPVVLCDAPSSTLGSWSRDGVILFAEPTSGIKRVTANGGTVTDVTTVDVSQGEALHSSPFFLPDGQHFLFYIQHIEPAKRGIYVRALDGGPAKQIVMTEARTIWAGINPIASRDGWLVFVRQGALLAQRFDLSRYEVSGDPLQLAEQVRIGTSGFNGQFSLSDNGTLVFLAGQTNQQLVLVNRAGQRVRTIGPLGQYNGPNFSPDEQRVAVAQIDPQSQSPDIHLYDLVGERDTRFTFDPAEDSSPRWSPDGGRIVWTSRRSGVPDLYWKAANGAGADELLWKSLYTKTPEDWSRDGRFILYNELGPQTNSDLWVLPLTGERKPWPWLKTNFAEGAAKFSPDGKWIAYATNAPGRFEVYVRAFNPDAPEAGGQWQISTNGGGQPKWRRDGRELYYSSADGKLMAVEMTLGAEAKPGTPRALFDLRDLRARVNNVGYAATGDGQRFLFVTSAEDAYLTPFTVVLNWAAEGKK